MKILPESTHTQHYTNIARFPSLGYSGANIIVHGYSQISPLLWRKHKSHEYSHFHPHSGANIIAMNIAEFHPHSGTNIIAMNIANSTPTLVQT